MKKKEENVAKSKVMSKLKSKPKIKSISKPKLKTQGKPKVSIKASTKSKLASKSKSKIKAKHSLKAKSPLRGALKATPTPPVKTKASANSGLNAKKSAKKVSANKGKTVPKRSENAQVPFNAAPKSIKIVNLSKILTPLDDRVVVQISESMRVTSGGLYIPDTVSDVSGNKEGTVVAVGRGHKDKKGKVLPMDVKVGDKVLFSGYAGSPFQWNSQELLILRENELLGIVNS